MTIANRTSEYYNAHHRVYPQNFEWSDVLVHGNFRMAMPTFFLISKDMLASVNFEKNKIKMDD